MISLLTIEQIKEELYSNDVFLIEYDTNAFGSEYFNMLVKELPDYDVRELRAYQKIYIRKGIATNILESYISELLNHLNSYNEMRFKVFNEFLADLKIDDIEGKFYILRKILKETKMWPKGKYKEWNYLSHGGDIEFDNRVNHHHFNVNMANLKDLKPWSIHRFLCSIKLQSDQTNFLVENKDSIPKMFDLLVLQNKLTSIRTPLGEKQYQLVE